MPSICSTASSIDEYLWELSNIKRLCNSFSQCKCFIGGDFNFDFNRVCNITDSVRNFCNELNFVCTSTNSNSDYTYLFQLERFSFIDHFFVSNDFLGSIGECNVDHSSLNLSDHDPIFLSIDVVFGKVNVPKEKFERRVAWCEANENHLRQYKHALSLQLLALSIPRNALCCSDLHRVMLITCQSLTSFVLILASVVYPLVMILYLV